MYAYTYVYIYIYIYISREREREGCIIILIIIMIVFDGEAPPAVHYPAYVILPSYHCYIIMMCYYNMTVCSTVIML